MHVKLDFRRGFKAEAERMDEFYRKSLGLSIFDPLDAFVLASHLGIDIWSVDEMFEGHKDMQQYALLSNPDRFSAVWTLNWQGEKLIIHNSNHSPGRQQSNLMHELAHIILGHKIPNEKAKLCSEFGLHYYNPTHELEAKFLGGCLQLTKPALLWGKKQRLTDNQIAARFNASEEMVRYRLDVSGVNKIHSRVDKGTE